MHAVEGDRGFTLVEVTIILLVLVILSTIMLPQLGNYNRLARFVKVKEDLGAICATMKKMLDEVMLNGPYASPGGFQGTPTSPVGLLVGPGTPPGDGGVTHYNIVSVSGMVDPWAVAAPVDNALQITSDAGNDVSFDSDLFENHLQVNDPFGTAGTDPGDMAVNRYKNVLDDAGVGAFFGWRGPYFDEFTADPWGTRYEANVFGLHGDGSGAVDGIYSTAVVCISFGPDKFIDTAINQPIDDADGDNVYGWVTGGDDIAVVLSAVGPF